MSATNATGPCPRCGGRGVVAWEPSPGACICDDPEGRPPTLNRDCPQHGIAPEKPKKSPSPEVPRE